MPEIGRPQVARNKFNNVKIRQKMAESNKVPSGSEEDVGKKLNQLAGVKRESRFVEMKNHNKMDKDAFLKLLSNQLANQDPFKPVDQKEFASDLAQFSQLEQMANMNSKLEKAFSNVPTQQKFMGANLLGKSILTTGTTLNVKADTSRVNLPFYIDQPAKQVMVRVFDSGNNLIQQFDLDGMGKGSQSIDWDLSSLDGTRAVNDQYRFDVTAWDDQYNQFKGQTRAEGKVTGVSFEGEEMILTIDDNRKVYLRDVHSFSGGGAAAKKAPLKQMATQTYNKINEQTQ